MAKTNSARSPKRIRRWLQSAAIGSVLLSSSLFGLIAVQGAQSAAHATSAATPPAPAGHSPVRGAESAVSRAATTVLSRAGGAANATAPSPTATPAVHARTRAS